MAFFGGILVLVLGLLASAGISSVQRTCLLDPITVQYPPIALSQGSSWSREFNVEKAEVIVVGPSPEDVAVDSRGDVYTGLKDGWIKRIRVGGVVENFTHHDGPILGLAVGPGDAIYFADADRGLFVVSQDKIEKHLSSEANGLPMRYFLPLLGRKSPLDCQSVSQIQRSAVLYTRAGLHIASTAMVASNLQISKFTDGVTVSKDGTVYFTDASTKFGLDDYVLDMLEGRPNGRLLKYDPSTGSTTVLAANLAFANGAALSEDEDFVLVCESSRARVHRYWLKGEKKGTLEPFIENLPGYPDNIRFSVPDKVFYIGLAAVRDRKLEWVMQSSSKLLRCLMAHPAAQALTQQTLAPGMLITVNSEGKLESKFSDSTGKMLYHITGGLKAGDYFYFTGIDRDFIGRFHL